MDETLKDILDTLAKGGQPLDVTVVTGTQYRHCTFIQHNPPAEPEAPEPPPAPAEPPSSKEPTLDERVAAAIAEVMELKDKQGDYLFRYVTQWQSIYRVLADRGVVKAGDYKGFAAYIAAICPAPLRIPLAAKSLSKTDVGLFAKPYKDWAPSRFDGIRTTYQRYALIAQAFTASLACPQAGWAG